jgi:hypothetical protein
MSNGLVFVVGFGSSLAVVILIVVLLVYRRHRQEQRFQQALALVESLEGNTQYGGKDLLMVTSAMSYDLLLRQAILERCEGIGDDYERESFVDDLVEIAEAYGNGLVKRSKSTNY